jgi:hypothetical protein
MKSSKKLILAVIVLLVLVGFAGCNIVDGGLQVEDVMSRKVSTAPGQEDRTQTTGAPKAFYATVNMYQSAKTDTLDMGNSNHHKTIKETLQSFPYEPYGGAIESNWDLLDDNFVIMSNVTNYNRDPLTGELSGTNHSVITIVDALKNPILTLQANGTIKGSIFGAEINMNWVAEESYGVNVNARGKVGGTFVWLGPGESEILPNGTFTLTGTYN